jgi:hypothetical protein
VIVTDKGVLPATTVSDPLSMAPGGTAVAENVRNNGADVKHKIDIFLITGPPLQVPPLSQN